jgi:hypothetical protein
MNRELLQILMATFMTYFKALTRSSSQKTEEYMENRLHAGTSPNIRLKRYCYTSMLGAKHTVNISSIKSKRKRKGGGKTVTLA